MMLLVLPDVLLFQKVDASWKKVNEIFQKVGAV